VDDPVQQKRQLMVSFIAFQKCVYLEPPVVASECDFTNLTEHKNVLKG